VTRGIGLDFGTTNSALAFARQGEPATVARFASAEGEVESFRSILFCGHPEGSASVESLTGPRAIERYLEHEGDGEWRLLQSLKAFLASRSFTSTSLFGRRTTLPDMISRIVRGLRGEVEARHGEFAGTGESIVVGRPVRFARSKKDDDDVFAEHRLRESLDMAGFSDVRFEYEPVAAAYHYEQQLDRDETVMIADFGGGTSDFCLIRVGPGHRQQAKRDSDILGTEGVAIAGDAFGAKIVRHVVAPRLGRGSQMQKLFGQPVPVPTWVYADLERWHHLSFLRSPRSLGVLYETLEDALEPEKIQALIHIVENDLGYHLYRSVEATKTALSAQEEAVLHFEDLPATIHARVARQDFEEWIGDELREIQKCADRLLERTRTSPEEVDRVFMTGGSSFVPAVREIFESRFGPEKIRVGGELISVASGLALRALDLTRR
jgi:hypothetical chaperone protein